MEEKYSTCLFKCPKNLTVYDYLLYISNKEKKVIPDECKECFNRCIIEDLVEDTKEEI